MKNGAHRRWWRSLRAAALAGVAGVTGVAGVSGCGQEPQAASGVDAMNQHDREVLLEIAAAAGVAPEEVLSGRWPARARVTDGRLTSLWLTDVTQLPDGALRRLDALRELSVEGPLANLSALAEAPGLRDLTLRGAQAADLTPLAQLPELRALSLQTTALTGLEQLPPASALPELTTLDLRDTPVRTLTGLGERPSLTRLTLQRCELTALDGVERLVRLHRADLRDNQVTDPRPLAGLPALRAARLEGNPISAEHFATLSDVQRRQLQVDADVAQRAALLANGPVETFGGTPAPEPPNVDGGVRQARSRVTWSGDRVEGEGSIGTLRGSYIVELVSLDPSDVIDPRRSGGLVRMTVRSRRGRVRLYLRQGSAYAYVEVEPGQTATLDATLAGRTHYRGFYLVAVTGSASDVRWTVEPR
jgi:hypothetical protein